MPRARSTRTAGCASAGARRARGETGLHAERFVPLGHLYEAYGFSNQGFYVFLAEGLTEGRRRPTPSEQDMQVGRFSERKMHELIAEGRFKDAPSVAALSLWSLRAR